MVKDARTDSGETSENSEYSRKLGERLRAIWAGSGIRQDEFARSIDIHPGTLNNYIQGKRLPTAELVDRIVSTYGANAAWLISGVGPMYDKTRTTIEEFTCESPCDTPLARIKVVDAHPDAVVAAQTVETVEADGCTLVMVPMVEARLSAGTGSFETGDSAERRYAFRSDWINLKGQAASMALMRVAGDSMEPQIFNNDMVLIDQSQTKPRAGSLFAVAVEDVVYIKMVDTLPGKIVLKSYNEAYAPLEIDARGDLADGIRIIGRAVWIGRELY